MGGVRIRYPIVAGKHKVICTKASIPKGMLIRDDIDIVNHCTTYGLSAMGLSLIEVLNQHHHTEWEKINKGIIWIFCPISIVHFHFMNEHSFCRVYALAWTIMKYGWISFLVYIYLEQPFHLQVTPALVLFTFFCSAQFLVYILQTVYKLIKIILPVKSICISIYWTLRNIVWIFMSRSQISNSSSFSYGSSNSSQTCFKFL